MFRALITQSVDVLPNSFAVLRLLRKQPATWHCELGKLAQFDEHWAPQSVATFTGHDVMVVKVNGRVRMT